MEQKQPQEEVMNTLRRELKITRYCSVFVAVLLVCVIAGGIYMANKIAPAAAALQEMQQTVEKLEELDVEMLNEKISQLDMEQLNQAIEGLDTEALSKALRSMNEAVEKLQKFGESFGSFSDSVGNSVSDFFGNGR